MARTTALLALATLCGAAPSPLAAQAVGVSALTFGNVFPGVTSVVSRTDALKAGQFRFTGGLGTNNAEVRIDLALPASLVSGPRTLPLVFGAGDGGYSTSGSITTATAFDPRAPLITRLGPYLFGLFGRIYIYVGGRAVPSAAQVAGTYTGTITMTVAYTGN